MKRNHLPACIYRIWGDGKLKSNLEWPYETAEPCFRAPVDESECDYARGA